MQKAPFYETDILLPKNTDMKKWSVVACDQYTSEPEYWQRVRAFVGEENSTLNITLPEIFLNDKVEERIIKINEKMREMLDSGVFKTYENVIIFIERTLKNGKKRQGLIGAVDLEEYSFDKGSQSLIRATEGTILERIPPRVKVRKNAPIELPHIMLLIDDRENKVFEPLNRYTKEENPVYAFELMEDGGSIKGYVLSEKDKKNVFEALNLLGDEKVFNEKYSVKDKGVLLFAVGDGNHSLATAKACYEELKKTMKREDCLNHPARYALAEVVNLHSDALEFEPIHRVLFNVDSENLLKEINKFFEEGKEGDQYFDIVKNVGRQRFFIKNPASNLSVGSLQSFIDYYIKNFGGEVDYIHGEDVVSKLCLDPKNIGFLLPVTEKNELFKTVILDGALPRKTFSMGHSFDKRFYLEARKISI